MRFSGRLIPEGFIKWPVFRTLASRGSVGRCFRASACRRLMALVTRTIASRRSSRGSVGGDCPYICSDVTSTTIWKMCARQAICNSSHLDTCFNQSLDNANFLRVAVAHMESSHHCPCWFLLVCMSCCFVCRLNTTCVALFVVVYSFRFCSLCVLVRFGPCCF